MKTKTTVKKFNPNNHINGIDIYLAKPIFLYGIFSDGVIFYVGITVDITSTMNRHFNKIYKRYGSEVSFKVIGEFYDRNIAEFFEMKLIEECKTNGLELDNIVTSFNN